MDLLLSLLLMAATPAPASPARLLAITGVTVIDPDSTPPRPGMTVVISGTRITAVGSTGKVSVPRGARLLLVR